MNQQLETKQQQAREIVKKLVKHYFKNDYGEPFELTDGQADIFLMIFLKQYSRNTVLTYTQYGKSDTISMALIMRTQIFHEPFVIVAGKKRKGMIIMERIFQHVFDHPQFYKMLEIDPDFPLERLRRQRSQDHVTWLGGGGVRIFSANVKNTKEIQTALIGEGGQNLIEEESPHIPDAVHAMVMRMMMGHKESFLLKIGNAFNNNHFKKSCKSPNYKHIVIDYHQGIREGRTTQERIDEVRDLPFFAELYECIFPKDDEVTKDGYKILITDEMIEDAFISEEEFQKLCTRKIKDDDGNVIMKVPEGKGHLGGDFAGAGRDRNAYVARWEMVAKILSTNKIKDTMQQVPIVEDYADNYGIGDEYIGIDYGGLGQGIGDRLIERERYVNCVMFGASADVGPDIETQRENKSKYVNMRAYMYYQLYLWLKRGGKLVRDARFKELTVIRYKNDSERKLKIQPKEELKELLKEKGITDTSPDIADGTALTFADSSNITGEDDVDII